MSNFNSKKYLNKQNETGKPWLILPFILTLTVIPFILGIYNFDNGLGAIYWQAAAGNSSTDIFLYYKSVALTIMGAILAVIFVIYRFSSQRKFSFGIAMIPIYVYIGCIVLSTAFSTDIHYSLHGIQHHFESSFVLLTYCMLVMYGTYFVNDERSLRWVINGFAIGTALLALFGLFQYSSGLVASLYTNGTLSTDSSFYQFMEKLTGYDEQIGVHWYEKLEPFKTQLMANYVYMPTGIKPSILSLTFPLGQVFLTLYNPNYIAYFTTLTAPFFFTLCFFQKKLWKKICFVLIAVASVICLLGSRSVAGFFSLGVSFAVLLVAFRKKIFKKWKIWLCALAAFIVALFVLNLFGSHPVTQRFQYMAEKLELSFEPGYHNDDTVGLRNLTSQEDGVKIEYRDSVLFFSMDYDTQNGITCTFKDEDGKVLNTKVTTDSDGEQITTLTDKAFADNISVYSYEYLPGLVYLPLCSLHIDDKDWVITNQIHTMTYSYVSGSELPFVVMQKAEDQTLGTYYYYNELPSSKIQELFQSFITDSNSLQACFGQLAKVSDNYAEIKNTIFNSSDPTSTAASYFQQLLEDEDALFEFFYYLTQASPMDSKYYYYNQVGKWTQIGAQPKTVLFENYPSMFSGRGFMWARSIPLLFKNAHNFLIGTGPDTFALNYPHYDYVSLYRGGYAGNIITKPHSLYLQVGVQTGVISALAIIAFFVLYLISTVKLYWKSTFDTLTSKVSVAILAGATGYMVSAITNDSTVTYAYVFWGLLGVGIAANHLELKHRQEEKEAAERAAHIEQKRLEREEKKTQKKTTK